MTIIWEWALLIAGSFPLHKAELRKVLGDLVQIQHPCQRNPGWIVRWNLLLELQLRFCSFSPSFLLLRVVNRVRADENEHCSAVSVCPGTPERDMAFPADIRAGRSKIKTNPNWKHSWVRTVLMWSWRCGNAEAARAEAAVMVQDRAWVSSGEILVRPRWEAR